MSNVDVAFEIMDHYKPNPVIWNQPISRLIFNIKMEFTKKDQWVKDGQNTPCTEYSTFSGVVSREGVHISLTYSAQNVIGVMADDIKMHTSNLPLQRSITLYTVHILGSNILKR